MNEKDKSFAYKIGRFIGAAVVVIAGGCIVAILLAFTYKFVQWVV